MLKWILIFCSCFGLATVAANGQTASKPRQSRLGPPTGDPSDYQPTVVLKKAIRPITDAIIVSADLAKLTDNQLVIGTEVNGAARAYPINQLNGPSREIINDKLGGQSIAATW